MPTCADRTDAAPPPIAGLLETALYVADLQRSLVFYRNVLGLAPMMADDRMIALDAGAQGVLLLFRHGATQVDGVSAAGTVPGHGGAGRLHMAFAIRQEMLDRWRGWLGAHAVALTGEMQWPRGGHSLYFDDPDGHVIELATPGLWPNR